MTTKLSPKQAAFISEYVKTQNATQSALKAGYSVESAKSIGCRLLENPRIQAKLIQATPIDESTVPVVQGDIISRIARIALKDRGAKRSEILKACELLGKYFKLWNDSADHSTHINAPQVTLVLPANGSEADNQIIDVSNTQSEKSSNLLTAGNDVGGEAPKELTGVNSLDTLEMGPIKNSNQSNANTDENFKIFPEKDSSQIFLEKKMAELEAKRAAKIPEKRKRGRPKKIIVATEEEQEDFL